MPRRSLDPPDHPLVRQLDVQVYGDRNYVLGRGRVLEPMLVNFEAAFRAFQAVHPHYTWEDFIRYVIRKGVASAVAAVDTRTVPPPR